MLYAFSSYSHTHLNLVPVAIVQLSAHGDDIRAATQIVPQTYGTLDQLDLEEIKRSAVVRVQNQAVRLFRLELELERSVQAGVPFAELRKRRLRTVQLEGEGAGGRMNDGGQNGKQCHTENRDFPTIPSAGCCW